jgi:GDP-L-fucose synthase
MRGDPAARAGERTDARSGLAGARVLVTGGAGFVGRHVLRRLEAEGCAAVSSPGREETDLRDPAATREAFARAAPSVVVHLAARVGGIAANQHRPATFWHENVVMGANVLDAARRAGARRVVVVGTVCAYPKHTPVPFREEDLWSGYPEETNAPYGVAKRALATGLAAYRQEFGLAGAYLLPANLYGPGDHFDLETSHVIPAMVRRCLEAVDRGEEEVVLWGTGTPSREFLYVEDAAEAIVRAAATVDDPTPMNVGTGREVTTATLAGLVAQATGFRGRFRWDASKPDGQPRRALDTSEAERRLGWRATTSLEDGLARTVAWYRATAGGPRSRPGPATGP